MEVLLLFILGLCVGSFLNVLIDRLPRAESVIKGRSYCESCKRPLKWHDLIPLFSFVILSGKCRYCQSPISFYYPIVEVVTGIMFVLTFFLIFTSEESRSKTCHLRGGTAPLALLGGDFLELGYYLFIISSLIVIFFADLKYGIIPDKITYPGIAISFLYLLFSTDYIIPFVASAVGAFLFFLAIFLITRGRGMGFGDVKFAFLLGLVLSFPKVIVGLYIAFLTGAFVSVILILVGKKKFRGSTVPFGPFLVIGMLTGLFWGDILLKTVLPFL